MAKNAYLLVASLKAENWDPDNCRNDYEEYKKDNDHIFDWSCGNTKKIKKKDRVFLIKVGREPKGMVASGTVITKKPYLLGDVNYVKFKSDCFHDPDDENSILSLEELEKINDGVDDKQYWTPARSGISIKKSVIGKLETKWKSHSSADKNNIFPEEISKEEKLFEGAKTRITVNSYERNPQARKKCIQHYGGTKCQVCNFDFGKFYGKIGEDFIHVHHIKDLAKIRKSYEVNPAKDLIPVCPNCHAMLHREKPALTIEKLKRRLKK